MVNTDIEPEAGHLKRADQDAFLRMVNELEGSTAGMAEVWMVVCWMMKNVYDPNTKVRLLKLLAIVERDMEKVQSDLRDEIQTWILEIDQPKEDYKKELADIQRLAGIAKDQ